MTMTTTNKRTQSQETVNSSDDKEFTIDETRNAVESMDNKKASGEDGITGEIYKPTFEIFSRFIAAMYNGCLRSGVFPKRWKRTKLIPRKQGTHNPVIHTDGCKSERGVRAGVAIFAGDELAAQLKFKLDKKCSNNQS
jgi:hypothetical protein